MIFGKKKSNYRIVDGKIVEDDNPVEITNTDPDRLGKVREKHKPVSAEDILPLHDVLYHKSFPANSLRNGLVPIGIDRKTGELLFSSWQRMTTGIIAGRRNFGKSSILKSMIIYALHARNEGLNARVFMIDPHHNLPDSTGLFFKPILRQFDGTFLGIDSLDSGGHIELFRKLCEKVKAVQEKGLSEIETWDFVFIDEADTILKHNEHGKEAYDLIEFLINLRKAGIFMMLSFADTTRQGSGKIGTSIVSAGTTVFCVNYDMQRARLVLQGKDEFRKALNLPVGFAAVKIPDTPVTVCKMPLVTSDDLKPFI